MYDRSRHVEWNIEIQRNILNTISNIGLKRIELIFLNEPVVLSNLKNKMLTDYKWTMVDGYQTLVEKNIFVENQSIEIIHD